MIAFSILIRLYLRMFPKALCWLCYKLLYATIGGSYREQPSG